MTKRWALIGLVVTLLVSISTSLASAATEDWEPEQRFIRIAGGVAGSWPPTAAKIAQLITKDVPGVAASALPGRTEQNLIVVGTGEADIAFSMGYAAAEAYRGVGIFRVPFTNLRHLASLNVGIVQIGVSPDSPFQTIEDLARYPVRTSFSGAGSFQDRVTRAILQIAGTSYEDVRRRGGVVSDASLEDGTRMMQDGLNNFLVHIGPAPYSLFIELESTRGVRFLELNADQRKQLMELIPGFYEVTVPASAYDALAEPYQTVATPYMLFVRDDLSEEMVYRITKAMFDNLEELQAVGSWGPEITLENALQAVVLPVHPGAARYYREQGLEVPQVTVP